MDLNTGVFKYMQTALISRKRLWKRALLLCTVGAALSFLLKASLGKPDGAFFSDLFFTISSLFLFVGLWGLIKNLGTFNSLKFGFKSLILMFRGKRETPKDKMVGTYLEYVQSRPRDQDAPWMMAFALVFLLLSALASMTMF